jgi:tetratricopeptide (TPR) repeat protein
LGLRLACNNIRDFAATAAPARALEHSGRIPATGVHANLLFDRGDVQRGNDLYRQAIKIAPNAEGVYHRWGNALLGANRYEAAIDKYKKAIEIKNTFPASNPVSMEQS